MKNIRFRFTRDLNRIAWGLLLFIVLSVFSVRPVYAQNIPDLGGATESLWTKAEELSMGQKAYQHMRQRGQIHDNPADVDYLDYLGQRIGSLAKTRLGLRFYLTQSKAVNAFAMPGGYIGVNAGLVLLTENEHELAGVLAHEIAHISHEHIARSILSAKDRQWANAATAAASILLATTTENADVGAGGISAVLANETQQQLNTIRQHEKEADRAGRELMQQAGFNPLGMQLFFAKLFVPEYAQNTPAFLLTHPMPIDRQADLDDLRAKNKNLNSSDEYYLFRARLRASYLSSQQLADLIQRDTASDQSQVKNAGYYMAALKAFNQGQFKDALTQIEQMNSRFKRQRDVQLLQTKIMLLLGDTSAAKNRYESLWSKFVGDSIVGYDYAYFLTQQQQYEKAASILSRLTENQAAHAQIYWLYGQVLGQLNQRLAQQQMLIRYYEQTHEYQNALNQVKIALNQLALSTRDRVALQAKEQQLTRILADSQ